MELNIEDRDSLSEYRQFKKLRQGYKERLANGYYSQTDQWGGPRTDLHDEYDEFVAYKNQKIIERRPKLEDPSDVEYATHRRQQQVSDETFLASAPFSES